MFATIKKRKARGSWLYDLFISVVEIYNEKIRDLLWDQDGPFVLLCALRGSLLSNPLYMVISVVCHNSTIALPVVCGFRFGQARAAPPPVARARRRAGPRLAPP